MFSGKSLPLTLLGITLMGLPACGGEEDEPGAVLSWITEPVSSCERGETIEASWTVTSELDVVQSYLLVCTGVVPDCGLTGGDAITFSVAAAEADGVYSATIEATESGTFTFVGFADMGEGAYISPPMGVIVDQRAYPPPPYGYRVNDIIQNFSLQGYMDTDADADDDPFNEEPREIFMESFFSGQDLDARVLLLQVSAGWCSACQEETQYLRTIYDEYRVRGARFYTVLFEDDNNPPQPADVNDIKAWGTYFGSHWPHGADPTDKLGPYFPSNEVPLNVFVDLETMEIVEVHTGFSGDLTRQILNAYVD